MLETLCKKYIVSGHISTIALIVTFPAIAPSVLGLKCTVQCTLLALGTQSLLQQIEKTNETTCNMQNLGDASSEF